MLFYYLSLKQLLRLTFDRDSLEIPYFVVQKQQPFFCVFTKIPAKFETYLSFCANNYPIYLSLYRSF